MEGKAPTTDEQKQLLRRQMIQKREAMSQIECLRAAEGFRVTLPALLTTIKAQADPAVSLKLGVYCSIRQEADLTLACRDLLIAGGVELYYPAIKGRGKNAEMVFGRLPSGCAPEAFLTQGCFGIAEPKPDNWLTDLPLLDIVLLPGLAFDRSGNRLGWGRAFYDRLIPRLCSSPVLVGVCYDFQLVSGPLPTTADDRPVEWLLMPDGILATV